MPDRAFTAYKIFEVGVNLEPLFLYHGLNGTRKCTTNTWMQANTKQVRDGSGSKYYRSGFNYFNSPELAQNWIDRHGKPNRIICRVLVRKISRKPRSRYQTSLADELKIIAAVWTDAVVKRYWTK